jgi:replication factor C subunit 3/5
LLKALKGILPQAASGDFPHLLFYGPSGSGKKTRITATLRQLFGPGVEKVRFRHMIIKRLFLTWEQLKLEQRVFVSPTKRKLEINIVQSNFHIEITPRCVVQRAQSC